MDPLNSPASPSHQADELQAAQGMRLQASPAAIACGLQLRRRLQALEWASRRLAKNAGTRLRKKLGQGVFVQATQLRKPKQPVRLWRRAVRGWRGQALP